MGASISFKIVTNKHLLVNYPEHRQNLWRARSGERSSKQMHTSLPTSFVVSISSNTANITLNRTGEYELRTLWKVQSCPKLACDYHVYNRILE